MKNNTILASSYSSKINKLFAFSHIPLTLFSLSQGVLLSRPENVINPYLSERYSRSFYTIKPSKSHPEMPLFLDLGENIMAATLPLEKDLYLIAGPVISREMNYQEFYSLHNKTLSSEEIRDIYEAYSQAPLMNLYHFSNILSIAVEMFFHVDLSYSDIILHNYGKKAFPSDVENVIVNHASRRAYKKIDSLDFEKRTQDAIIHGDLDALKEAFHHPARLHAKDLHMSEKTYSLVSFTAFGTLMSRAAIEGGISPFESLSLFDLYLKNVLNIKNQDEIFTLLLKLSTEYCHMVKELTVKPKQSLIIRQCIRYIQNNLDQKITADDLAEITHSSVRTISRHFHDYLGTGVSEYIIEAKLKEAAKLLAVSDNTISEISSSLSFSSQGYFTTLFQKHFHETPHEYRQKHKYD